MMDDGVYFGLPFADYLEIDRLSKSGIKELRVSPADYWEASKKNPDREDKETDAMVAGSAYHCGHLEPERFTSDYVRELAKDEMPDGTLFTGNDMKAWLKDHDLKQTGTVAEQAERIFEADPAQPVWQTALAEWEAGIEPGQQPISAKLYDDVVRSGKRLHSVPKISALISGGAAEVSVLYTCPDTGIPMKARFDKLKSDRWIELKSFSNPHGKNLNQCILDAFRYSRYHIDAVSYLHAAQAITGLEIVGDATGDERAMIAEIKERGGNLDCYFVFQQVKNVPNILDRRFRFYESDPVAELEQAGAPPEKIERARKAGAMSEGGGRTRTAIHTKARMEIAAAKRDYEAYSAIYAPGEPWLPFDPSGEITDADFPPYYLESV